MRITCKTFVSLEVISDYPLRSGCCIPMSKDMGIQQLSESIRSSQRAGNTRSGRVVVCGFAASGSDFGFSCQCDTERNA